MTTFTIILLTVLGTIGVEILILVLFAIFDNGKSIQQIDIEKTENLLNAMIYSSESLEFVDLSKVPKLEKLTNNELEVKAIKEGRWYVNDLFKKLNSKDTEPITDYLDNLSEYKDIINKTPDKFLNYHFQNSIRDEQYELSQYISDVAKERGITLKAELN